MHRAIRRRVAGFVVVAAVLVLFPFCGAVPPGFVDEEVSFLSVRGRAIALNFVPKQDGGHAMLVVAKAGELHVLRDPDVSSEHEVVLDLSDRMCSDHSRGLQAVVPDPDFVSTGWIYLFYTLNKFGNCDESNVDGPVNRVSRFVMNQADFVVDKESETVFLETPSLLTGQHHGGDMGIGKDGMLYVTTGDGGDRRGGVSQNVSNLHGSILRLTREGTIPSDNPFTTATGYRSARCDIGGVVPSDVVLEADESVYSATSDAIHCEEIYANGLRNPFRFAFDPNSDEVRAFINDVGGSVWEEMNELVRGANYGWSDREGPCRFGRTSDCGPHEFTDPVYWYQHGEEGGAAVGLAVVPDGLWPEEYNGSIIYADYVFNRMFELKATPELACRTCLPPVPGWKSTTFHDFDRIIHLGFGPYQDTQALYYIARAATGGSTSHLQRIRYVGGANTAPAAVLLPSVTQGLQGVDILFDGSGSSDPDGDDLTFVWDFGDASETIEGPVSVTHRFESLGSFTVSLTVVDTYGFSDRDEAEITVGDPPVLAIDLPQEGTEFAVGDALTLRGSAVDRRGRNLADADLSWVVRLHHNTHFHPFLDETPGNDIKLQGAPSPEDFLAANNSHLEIILTATDRDGIRASATRIVMPSKITLDFDTEPSGLQLALDGYTVTTPVEVLSWEKHQLQAAAPDQHPWQFVSWSNNEPQVHLVDVVDSVDRQDAPFVATFVMGPTVAPTTAGSAGPAADPTDSLITPTELGTSAAPTLAGARTVAIGGVACLLVGIHTL